MSDTFYIIAIAFFICRLRRSCASHFGSSRDLPLPSILSQAASVCTPFYFFVLFIAFLLVFDIHDQDLVYVLLSDLSS